MLNANYYVQVAEKLKRLASPQPLPLLYSCLNIKRGTFQNFNNAWKTSHEDLVPRWNIDSFFYISKLLPVSLSILADTGLADAAYPVVLQTVTVRFSCLKVIIDVFTTMLEFPGLHSTYLNVNTRCFFKVHLLSFGRSYKWSILLC